MISDWNFQLIIANRFWIAFILTCLLRCNLVWRRTSFSLGVYLWRRSCCCRKCPKILRWISGLSGHHFLVLQESDYFKRFVTVGTILGSILYIMAKPLGIYTMLSNGKNHWVHTVLGPSLSVVIVWIGPSNSIYTTNSSCLLWSLPDGTIFWPPLLWSLPYGTIFHPSLLYSFTYGTIFHPSLLCRFLYGSTFHPSLHWSLSYVTIGIGPVFYHRLTHDLTPGFKYCIISKFNYIH